MQHPENLEKAIYGEDAPEKRKIQRDMSRPVVLYIGKVCQSHLDDEANERLHLSESDVLPVSKD